MGGLERSRISETGAHFMRGELDVLMIGQVHFQKCHLVAALHHIWLLSVQIMGFRCKNPMDPDVTIL